jgi:hypothetical protein
MNRYIVPKIFCALGAIAVFAGIFLSELNITLGDMLESAIIAIVITVVLLLLAILAFNMKTAHRKKCLKKTVKCKTVEYFSLVLFIIAGICSLAIFNHCITVWQSTDDIERNMNIHQLENILPEYERYANKRIEDYEVQLNEAVRNNELRELGFNVNCIDVLDFDVNSVERLESQKNRKIIKLKQVVYPHIYDSLKISITDSINKFVSIVEDFSPLTMPKNITRIEEWAKSWEKQLISFSYDKMKGENAKDFQFESTFGNVEDILTNYKDYFAAKRILGYGFGLFALICMLFPYIFGNRSIKITKTNN